MAFSPQTAQLRVPRQAQTAGAVMFALACGTAAALHLSPTAAATAALAALCLTLWAAALAPEHWTAFLFFTVASIAQLAPAQIIFSGFLSSAFWLLFAGMVLGAAIKHTGLGVRMASMLSQLMGASYASIIGAILLFVIGLSFLIPSSIGRIALTLPVVASLADQMNYGARANGRVGMLCAAAFGSFAPAFAILPANGPNMILAGMAETLYGLKLSYVNYLFLHFPVLGALKAGALLFLILWMFPDSAPSQRPQPRKPAPITLRQKQLIAVLAGCLALWATDSLHGVSAGWTGLAAALYCLWPSSGLTSENCLNTDINYSPLFFVAGLMGLGAVVSDNGLGSAIVEALREQTAFAPDAPIWNAFLLTAFSSVIALVTNLPGVPTLITPAAESLSQAAGAPLQTVLMTQVLAFSNVFLPYQAPPLIAAMQMADIPRAAVVKLCLALFAVGLFVLIPLDLLWWRMIGMI